jgi:N-formylglutamate amidohydrolase
MVELNRRLYMDETTGAQLPGFDDALRRNQAAIAQIIAAFREPPT